MQITICKYASEMKKQTNSTQKETIKLLFEKKKKNSHPVFYESPPLLNRGTHELKPLILPTVSTCKISVSIP